MADEVTRDEITIGELARSLGVTLRALRFWESKGLITPRRVRNRRLYDRDGCARAEFVKLFADAGASLAEIRDMLARRDAGKSVTPAAAAIMEREEKLCAARGAGLARLRRALTRETGAQHG